MREAHLLLISRTVVVRYVPPREWERNRASSVPARYAAHIWLRTHESSACRPICKDCAISVARTLFGFAGTGVKRGQARGAKHSDLHSGLSEQRSRIAPTPVETKCCYDDRPPESSASKSDYGVTFNIGCSFGP